MTDPGSLLLFVITFAVVIVVWRGVKLVPQQQRWVVERFNKYDRTLVEGLHIINPFFSKVSYKLSLKEDARDIPAQAAITRDNVTLVIDGIIYVRIVDAYKAAYGSEDPYYAVVQLAQTTMRSEIGKLELDKTFEERESLNQKIVDVINEAAESWGIECRRYEIKDINPPQNILLAMEQQVTAEREKRAVILASEGKRQASINIAEGQKQEVVLESEASMTDQINRATGESEAIRRVADATAEGIEKVAAAIMKTGGERAVALKIAEKYVDAFGKLAKESTTVLLPANAGDAGSMVAQALSVYDTIRDQGQGARQPSPWDDGKKKKS